MAYKTTLRWFVLAVFVGGLSAPLAIGQEKKPDPWEQVRFLVGEWEGTAKGEAGTGTVRRTYSFVLKDRYLHEKNVSTYPAQEANKSGEVHEHWSMLSYDRARATLVLRQFHQEGFVNQYSLNKSASEPKKLVFESEHFENLDSRWKARETYEIRSADEFVETFELAAPGKELQVYSRNSFKRVVLPSKTVTTKTGLSYQIIVAGIGPAALPGQSVRIHETTTLADGTLIYSTRTNNKPLKFLLGGNQAIAGVDEGVTGMKVGERRKLVVPPALSKRSAYPANTPPDAILYYDIELVEILDK